MIRLKQCMKRKCMYILGIWMFLSIPYAMGQQSQTVQGIIKDQTGQVLVGAGIRIVESSEPGTKSNEDGRYTINVAPGQTLQFSYVGYEPKKVLVTSEQTVIDIVFEMSKKQELQEVVVIGYGAVKKEDLTGSVVNVKMDDIKDVPTLSIDNALQGRVAGMDVMSTTGEPGSSATIRIRGTRSITADNEPLIVVDGVMDAVQSIADINATDIEDITILKDASSTAIYGSRGANGVIIITTKKGFNTPKPTIRMKTDYGIAQIPRYLDIMNATEFAQYYNDYAFNSTTFFTDLTPSSPMSDYPFPDPWAHGEGTNWTKAITRVAPYQDQSLSVSGGSNNSAYYSSFGYNNTDGIIRNSGAERYTFRFKVDYDLLKNVKVGYNLSFTKRDQDRNMAAIGGQQPWNAAIYLSPFIGPEDSFNPIYNNGQAINNPMHYINLGTNNEVLQTTGHVGYIQIKPMRNLEIKSQFSHWGTQTHDYRYESSLMPTKSEEEGGTAYRREYDVTTLLSETTASYKFQRNNLHFADALVGFTASDRRYNNLTLQGKGYLIDDNKWNNMNAIADKENYTASSTFEKVVKSSILGRFNYNFRNTYYITFTGRYDMASNFAANQKGGFFPSAAIKWSSKNESFMANISWLDELSFRLSAGRTGNDGIPPYRALGALASSTNGYLFDGSQPLMYYPSRLESKNLTWEKTDSYNAATDISLFRNRVNLTFEAYLSYTRDLLLTPQLPSHTGFSSKYANLGKTRNKGVELSVETRNIASPKFFWRTNFTFMRNKQMVDDIGQYSEVSVFNSYGNNVFMMYGYKAGYPLNALWGLQYEGVWHDQEEIIRNEKTKTYVSAAAAWYKPGYQKYLDVNQSGNIDSEDLIYLGNADPWLQGGLQNTFKYQKLSLGVYVAYSLGGKIYNISEQWLGSGSFSTNQYRYMLDAYHPIRNPNSNLPGAGNIDNLISSRMVHDATYVRLKNVSLGYVFNTKKVTKNIISDVTFTVAGENLYLWKKYNGFDPDVTTAGTSSTLRRIDNGAYPKARTVVFSLQLKY